jgi:hypothetical protein
MGRHTRRGRNRPHAIDAGDPDAIVLIKEEHQMFRALFDRAEESEGGKLTALAGEICLRLTIHMMIEEEILYPALGPLTGAEPIDECIVEHDLARARIMDLIAMTGGEELYKPKIHVLGESTMHHFDKEDRILLEPARMAWERGGIDLVELGRKLRERRQRWYDRIDALSRRHREPDMKPVGREIEEVPDMALEPASPKPRRFG